MKYPTKRGLLLLNDGEWLNTKQAGWRIGCSRQYVHRLIRQGRLDVEKRGYWAWVSVESVDEYMDSRRHSYHA